MTDDERRALSAVHRYCNIDTWCEIRRAIEERDALRAELDQRDEREEGDHK